MNNQTAKGICYALLTGVSWGCSSVFIQYLQNEKHMDTLWMVSYKMLFGGLLMLFYCLYSKSSTLKNMKRHKKDIILLLAYSIFGLVATQICYINAIKCSNAGAAVALNYSCMIFILFIGCIQEKRSPFKSELIALALAIIGVMLIATHGRLGTLIVPVRGLVWGFASAVAQTAYSLLPKPLVGKYKSEEIVTVGMLIGALGVGSISGSFLKPVAIDGGIIVGMIGIIIFGTVVPFLFFLKSIMLIGSVQTSMFVAVETVAAPLLGALVLHTKYTVEDFLGFICMIVMVIFLSYHDLTRIKRK